jgi:hypothetical protein
LAGLATPHVAKKGMNQSALNSQHAVFTLTFNAVACNIIHFDLHELTERLHINSFSIP